MRTCVFAFNVMSFFMSSLQLPVFISLVSCGLRRFGLFLSDKSLVTWLEFDLVGFDLEVAC